MDFDIALRKLPYVCRVYTNEYRHFNAVCFLCVTQYTVRVKDDNYSLPHGAVKQEYIYIYCLSAVCSSCVRAYARLFLYCLSAMFVAPLCVLVPCLAFVFVIYMDFDIALRKLPYVCPLFFIASRLCSSCLCGLVPAFFYCLLPL